MLHCSAASVAMPCCSGVAFPYCTTATYCTATWRFSAVQCGTKNQLEQDRVMMSWYRGRRKCRTQTPTRLRRRTRCRGSWAGGGLYWKERPHQPKSVIL
jgi:hypothetical protein